jgi:excisionase family DNA binding protein
MDATLMDPIGNSLTCLPGLLDVKVVARLLGCSTRTVWRWSDGGQMPRPTRIGGLVRWSRASLERWLDRKATGSGREVFGSLAYVA